VRARQALRAPGSILAAEAGPDDAVEQLARALEIYRQLGATARIARAGALLSERGQRAG
jgi:hypothetical protein